MAEDILPYEKDWFLWLNSPHSEFWDVFMTLFSGKIIWIPLIIIILGVFIYKTSWKEALLVALAAVVLVVLCDQISASVIKPFFARLRPSHHPDFKNYVILVEGYRGGPYGFVSAHATNSFGVAVFFSLLFRYRYLTLITFAWAIINCYSRIYLGVHFFSDVIGGAIVGLLLGIAVYYLYLFVRQKLLKVKREDLKNPIYSHDRAKILITTLTSIILTIICTSLIAISF